MPYVYNPEDEQNQNGNPSAPPPPQNGAGSGAAFPATSTGAPYVNLQKYLAANQDQTSELANKLSNPIEEEAASAKTKSDAAKGSFQNQVQGSTVIAPTFLDQLSYNPAGLSADQKNEVKQKSNASYSGPQNIESTGLLNEAQGSLQKAKEASELSKTNPGRFSLLQNFVNSPNYQKGQTRLDQALLSGSEEARNRLGQAQQKVGENEQSVAANIQEANAFVNPAKQQTEATKNTVNSKLNEAVQKYLSDLQMKAGSESAARSSEEQRIQSGLKNKNLNQQDIDNLGLKDYAGKSIYGANPYDFYKGADTNIDINEAATPEQKTQLAALQDLQGRANPYVNDVLAPTNRSFDIGGFSQAVNANKGKYDQGLQGAIKNSLAGLFKGSVNLRNNIDEIKKSNPGITQQGIDRRYQKLPNGQYVGIGNEADRQKVLGAYQSAIDSLSQYSGNLNVNPVPGGPKPWLL